MSAKPAIPGTPGIQVEALASAITRRLNDSSGASHQVEALASSVSRRLTGAARGAEPVSSFDVDAVANAIALRLQAGTAPGQTELPANP